MSVVDTSGTNVAFTPSLYLSNHIGKGTSSGRQSPRRTVAPNIYVDPRYGTASCHSSAAQTFEVDPRFLENL